MQAGNERPTPSPTLPPPATPLSYAEPDPPRRVSWLDLAGHAMFGLGIALALGGFVGREYNWGGWFGDVLREYYPHMIMSGGFICGILGSVRLGPFAR